MPDTQGIGVIANSVPEIVSPCEGAVFRIRGIPVSNLATGVVHKSPEIWLVERVGGHTNDCAIVVHAARLFARIVEIGRVEHPCFESARGLLRLKVNCRENAYSDR